MAIGVPSRADVSVSGSCNYTGAGEDLLALKFRGGWSLSFIFSSSDVGSMLKADNKKKFWWKQVNLNFTYDADLFPNINQSYGKNNSVEFC